MPLAPALLLCAQALAAPPAHYHADAVGPHSTLFTQSSALMSARFEAVQAEMARISPGLVALDLDAALVSRRAPPAYLAYAAELRREGAGQRQRVQVFVDTLVGDFEDSFQAALQRALPSATQGYDAVQCKTAGVAALMGRTLCKGEDLNPALGRALDQDPLPQQAVQEIESLSWPSFAVEGRDQPVLPLTGVGSYLRLDALAMALVGPAVAGAQARLDEALEPVQAEIEEGDDEAARRAALERARSLRDLYERELGLLGEELLAAVHDGLVRQQKRGAPAAVGVCANPEILGGCPGADATAAVLPLLQADRKLLKALAP